MSILVFNSGSSSLKCRYFERREGALVGTAVGSVRGFGHQADCTWNGPTPERSRAALHGQAQAARWAIQRWRRDYPDRTLDAIGHRLVHGGSRFRAPTPLTPDTLAQIEALSPLAPLHNPPALEVVRACREVLGESVPMAAVFDTAFFTDLPEGARRYALPADWTEAHGLHRYGFHGIAHRFMYRRYLERRRERAESPRVITFQLGNGCSAAAIRDGRPLDTSMGYTALAGLIMSTRPGDVDPGTLLALVEAGVTPAALREGLYHRSGLQALSGTTSDMRRLLELEAQGDERARFAVAAFCRRARLYLGAYLALLGGADAIVFGGGIGEYAPSIRARICEDMEWCGLKLDPEANDTAKGIDALVSPAGTRTEVHVVAVDEEQLIAQDVLALLASAPTR